MQFFLFWLLWNVIVLIICLQQSVLLFDKHGMQFPLATVRNFCFTLLNSILSLPVMSFRFRFLQNASIGICWNVSSNVGSIFKSCQCCWSMLFCLEVSCYKWLIMEGMMLFYFYFVPQEEHVCLILQLFRFGFLIRVSSYPRFTNWFLVVLIWASNSEFVEQILLTRSAWL